MWPGIMFFWNMTVREWVIVPDASKQASGMFTLKIRKRRLEKAGSDYSVTHAIHRHTQKTGIINVSLSLSRLFDSILHLHAVTNGAKE